MLNEISLNDFANYLSNLSSQNSNAPCMQHNVNIDKYVEELDIPITVEEIHKVIMSLGRHKNSDLDKNVAGFFLSIVTASSHLFYEIF